MSNIKRCFRSRFGELGRIVSIDFSQLEIRYLAFLTQDEQLKRDIESGMDLHRVRASELFDIQQDAVTGAQRTIAKSLSFELQYGAGAKSMSEKHNLPQELCQKFIDNYYSRYPQVKKWQDNLVREIKKLGEPSKKRSTNGHQLLVAKWRSNTGRIYTFYESESPEYMQKKGVLTSFNPPRIKNYPMQGGGSDIVALARGKLMRAMLKHNWYMESVLPIMTVHDSIEFDCVEDYVEPAIVVINSVIDRIPVYFEKLFGIELNVKLPVDIKTGFNWMEMEKYKCQPLVV